VSKVPSTEASGLKPRDIGPGETIVWIAGLGGDVTLTIASSDAVTKTLGFAEYVLLVTVDVESLADSPGAERRGADVLL
jgi:hypothetical protein